LLWRLPGGTNARKDFLTDLCDQPVKFRLVHEDAFFRYFRSMSMIFRTRA
jgi:hypothetical protein